jgi:vanillate O-demethylase ferredoxin subunit
MRFAEQWNWCTVDSIRDVTPTIREFRLRPENGRVAPCPPGSHITVSLLIDGQPARRSYSLVENSDPGTYRIAVRLAPDSRGGSRGMWNLRARGSRRPTPPRCSRSTGPARITA